MVLNVPAGSARFTSQVECIIERRTHTNIGCVGFKLMAIKILHDFSILNNKPSGWRAGWTEGRREREMETTTLTSATQDRTASSYRVRRRRPAILAGLSKEPSPSEHPRKTIGGLLATGRKWPSGELSDENVLLTSTSQYNYLELGQPHCSRQSA